MPGTQRDIPYLEDKFQTGDVPTQQDFYDLFASFLHYLQVKQVTGVSTSDVMSQKAISDLFTALKDNVPTAGDTLNKLYNLIVGMGRYRGGFDASSGAVPAPTADNEAGDFWRITVAGTIGTMVLKAGDVLIADIDDAAIAANFYAVQSNVDQATEVAIGLLQLITQALSEDAATNATVGNIDHARAVTGRGLRWFWDKAKTLAHTFAAKITFTTAPRFSSTSINQVLEVDGNRDLISSAKKSAYNKDFASGAEAQTGTEAAKPIAPNVLAAWWTWVKTQAQTITALWTFADVKLTNQAATTGTYKGLIIDDAGKVLKEANIIYDPATKQLKLKAVNILATSYTLVIVDSNDEVIAQFRNDKSFELGGSSAIIEVNPGIESGNAAIRFLPFTSGIGIGFRFQDSNLNDYLNFRSLTTDRAVVLKQTTEHDHGKGEKRIEKQFTVTTDTTADGYTTVFEFTLEDLEHYDIKVLHADATAIDSVSITSLGVDSADVRKVASSNIEGNTSVATQSRLPSSVTTGGFEWNLDTTNQKIQYRFKNVTGSGKTFVVWVDVSYVKRITPVTE